HGDVVDAQLVECALGGGGLRAGAVDHDQVGRVGELARLARLGVDRAVTAVGLGGDLAGGGALLQVAAEPAQDDLVYGGDVAVLGPDREPAVFALAGQAVLEHHHGGDDVLALEVGDVVALDAQRRLVEVERVGDLL